MSQWFSIPMPPAFPVVQILQHPELPPVDAGGKLGSKSDVGIDPMKCVGDGVDEGGAIFTAGLNDT
jgi:hypothetical protein